MCVCSGVATFWRPALISQWVPLTEITILKNYVGLLNFPSFCFDNLQFEDLRKINFFLSKIFIFAYITTPALCRPGLLQHWRPRLSTVATTLSTNINFNFITVFFWVVLCNRYLYHKSSNLKARQTTAFISPRRRDRMVLYLFYINPASPE